MEEGSIKKDLQHSLAVIVYQGLMFNVCPDPRDGDRCNSLYEQYMTGRYIARWFRWIDPKDLEKFVVK